MLLIHTLQDEGGICAAVKTAQIATDGREENMEGERARWGEVYCVPVMPRRPHLCTVSQKAAYDLRIAPLLAPQARIGRCMCHRNVGTGSTWSVPYIHTAGINQTTGRRLHSLDSNVVGRLDT